tara:strand:+ start:644 stop:1285 length:642 start_codon:yes stop_codon:yes gene_type:complete
MSSLYQQSSQISKLYTSRKVLLKQLESQGYNTENYDEFSINELHIMHNNKQIDMLLSNNRGSKAYIKYYLGRSLRPQNIHDFIDDLFNLESILTNKDMLIIITKDKSSRETLMAQVKQLWAEDLIYVNIIDIMSLQFNVLEHEMVPSHKKLNDEQIIEMKKRYNIVDNSKIPEISRFDPVAIAIGLRPGDICEIIRPSITSITGNYYRYCINN